MSQSRSKKADPRGGPGAKMIHLGRGQIGLGNYEGGGKKSNKQRLAVAAEGAKNLMAGYETRAKAKKK